MAGKQYGKLARRYAVAFLKSVEAEQGAAGKPSPAQQLAGSLNALAQLWESEPEFSSSILNPMFDASDRLRALLEIARSVGVLELGVRMIEVVFERDRIAAFPQIVRAFSELADERSGLVHVQVAVAREISEEEKRQIEGRFRELISGELRFAWSVRPEIIGGMVVRYQGKVLDGSLSGRLQRIEERLMA